MEMHAFFSRMYQNRDGFESYISMGCFTPKFCMTLLESQPPQDKIILLSQIATLDYKSQIQVFFDFNNRALKQLFILRNVSIEDVFTQKPRSNMQRLPALTVDEFDPQDSSIVHSPGQGGGGQLGKVG